MNFTGGLCRAAQVHQGGETEGEHGLVGLEVGEGGDVGAGQHGQGQRFVPCIRNIEKGMFFHC